MGLPAYFNNNGGLGTAAASGTFCPIQVSLPITNPTVSTPLVDCFDSISYLITTGTLVSAGSVSVDILQAFLPATWVTMTTPNSATAAAFTLVATLGASLVYNGVISLSTSPGMFCPVIGARLRIAGLTGGSITYMQLIGVVRSKT